MGRDEEGDGGRRGEGWRMRGEGGAGGGGDKSMSFFVQLRESGRKGNTMNGRMWGGGGVCERRSDERKEMGEGGEKE